MRKMKLENMLKVLCLLAVFAAAGLSFAVAADKSGTKKPFSFMTYDEYNNRDLSTDLTDRYYSLLSYDPAGKVDKVTRYYFTNAGRIQVSVDDKGYHFTVPAIKGSSKTGSFSGGAMSFSSPRMLENISEETGEGIFGYKENDHGFLFTLDRPVQFTQHINASSNYSDEQSVLEISSLNVYIFLGKGGGMDENHRQELEILIKLSGSLSSHSSRLNYTNKAINSDLRFLNCYAYAPVEIAPEKMGNTSKSGGDKRAASSTNSTEKKNSKKAAAEEMSAPEGFVYIPAGSFMMGVNLRTPGARDKESPAHKVTLTRSFYMCDHEVTQKEYKELLGSFPSYFLDQYGKGDDYPMRSITWYVAIAYCNKRSAREGLTPCYRVRGVSDWANIRFSDIPTKQNKDWDNVSCNWDADGYRLPTEAEWEYAARAGSSSVDELTYVGSESAGQFKDYGWYTSNSNETSHPVKLKKPNAWGLYDMGGNVFEMVWDWVDLYSDSSQTDPAGSGPQPKRGSRGGDFYFGIEKCTVSYRGGTEPTKASANQGFRVCRTARVTGQ